jgi:hypothetical protein
MDKFKFYDPKDYTNLLDMLRRPPITPPHQGAMVERVPDPIRRGAVRVFREDTGEVLYEDHNIITNISRWLFAVFMAATGPEQPVNPGTVAPPLYGVWGLALGAGSPSWAPQTQPVETAQQVELIQPLVRVQLSRVNFVSQDNSGNWSPVPYLATNVDFETTVNSTVNNINQPIREMGLIGGGIANMGSYTMLTAPFFNGNPSSYVNPVTQQVNVTAMQQTVILINYKTLPPLNLPPGINIIFSWIFQF